MSIESSLDSILALMSGEPVIGREGLSAQFARGIDQSVLADVIRGNGADTAAAMAGLAGALGVATAEICTELQASNRFLATIENAAVNPLETAAQELYRRGVHALERGWHPEAIDALHAAVEKSPLSPEIWINLALAEVAEGRADSARSSLDRAYRYSVRDNPGLAAGIGLTRAGLERDQGDEAAELEALTASARDLPTCAELHLALARVTRSPEAVATAVRLAPELSAIAIGSVPEHSPTVRESLYGSSGVISFANHIRATLFQFASTFTPPVEVRWQTDFVGSIGEDALAAAESFNYLRTKLDDIWLLSRHAAKNGQVANAADRSLATRSIVAAATRVERIVPWKPGMPADPAAKPTSTKSVRMLVAEVGLVIPALPGEVQVATYPGQHVIDLSSETVGCLEVGDLVSAVDLMVNDYAWMSRDAAQHIAGEAIRRYL